MGFFFLELAAAAAIWAAVDPDDGASWIGGAAALTLLTIAIGFNASTLVRLRRENRETKAAQRNDQRVCNYQISVLASVLDSNGIPMPARFWDIPDEKVLDLHEQETKRRRRMFGYSEEHEEGWVTSVFVGTTFAVLAAFAIFALVLNLWIIGPLEKLEENSGKDRCNNSLTADYFVAIQRALAAPPAPSPERAAAVADLGITAERIRNRASICEDGEPNAFTPTLTRR